MHRISRVFETSSVVILKVAGWVSDEDLEDWKGFLEGFGHENGSRWTVLDFCDVSSVGHAAAELLVSRLPANVLLLNAPTAIKNMAVSGGRTSQILEPKDGEKETT